MVNQTVGGLSQGRKIEGNVVYLGGPLTFLKQLRVQFDNTLGLNGNCPEDSLYYVSIGAAMTPQPKSYTIDEALSAVKNCRKVINYEVLPPLFVSKAEYDEFKTRHEKARIETIDSGADFDGDVYFGIDAGSTTVKCVAINSDGIIVYSDYRPNSGNPVPIVKEFLEIFYAKYPKSKIAYSAVTGYGEDIIKNAFKIDLV